MTRLPSLRQKQIIWQALGYEPNPTQLLFHVCNALRTQIVGGERGGKSYMVAKELATRVPFSQLIWMVGPDYEQTKPEFAYLAEDLTRMNAFTNPDRDISMPRKGPWYMKTKSGNVIETKTSAHVEKIAGKAPNGIVLTEAAQQTYDVYLKTYGRLSQERGWLIAVGTFEGSLGWYPDVYRRWQGENAEGGRSFSLPTWSNTHKYPGGRNDPAIKLLESLYPPDLFNERFGAIPNKPAGLVFKEFDTTTHVQMLDTHDNLPVELWIDHGYAGAYAVLAVQIAGPYVHVIDEVYRRGLVAHEVIAICKTKPWWNLVKKVDKGTGGVIDVAGLQHQAMPSQVETWLTEAKVSLRYQPVPIEDGIQALRVMLKDPGTGEPRIFFNAHLDSSKDGQNRPNGTLAEFNLYRYKDYREGEPVPEKPIDANNHGLKALGYGLVDRFGPVGGRTPAGGTTRRKGWA